MNKIISSFILTASLCTWVQAQIVATPITTQPVSQAVNPIDVARAFALKTPAYFNCQLSGNMLISNAYQWVEIDFTVRKSDFAITNLAIDYTNKITLSEPIYGIPLGDGGLMVNAFLNVNAYTKTGDYAGNGNLNNITVLKH